MKTIIIRVSDDSYKNLLALKDFFSNSPSFAKPKEWDESDVVQAGIFLLKDHYLKDNNKG